MKLPVYKPIYYFLKIFRFPVVWEISVGSVTFREREGKREYLLLHYPSGHFDFPKGHVEDGETDEMTLRRETAEETGIQALEVLPKRISIKYFYVAKGNEREKRRRSGRGLWIFKQVHFYPARTTEEQVSISHEHVGYIWLPYDAAMKQVTFDNAKRVLSETEMFLQKVQS